MPPRRGRARRLHRSSAAPRGGQVPVLPASHPRRLGRSYPLMKMHVSTWWRGRPRLRAVLIMVTALLLIDCTSARSGETPKVRPAAVAGSFYPADPKALETMIDGFLAKAAPPPLTGVVALVSPHAGYEYAGQVAAYSYALLEGRKFDRVVVMQPSHYEAFASPRRAARATGWTLRAKCGPRSQAAANWGRRCLFAAPCSRPKAATARSSRRTSRPRCATTYRRNWCAFPNRPRKPARRCAR